MEAMTSLKNVKKNGGKVGKNLPKTKHLPEIMKEALAKVKELATGGKEAKDHANEIG
jgi:hypothetical protein